MERPSMAQTRNAATTFLSSLQLTRYRLPNSNEPVAGSAGNPLEVIVYPSGFFPVMRIADNMVSLHSPDRSVEYSLGGLEEVRASYTLDRMLGQMASFFMVLVGEIYKEGNLEGKEPAKSYENLGIRRSLEDAKQKLREEEYTRLLLNLLEDLPESGVESRLMLLDELFKKDPIKFYCVNERHEQLAYDNLDPANVYSFMEYLKEVYPNDLEKFQRCLAFLDDSLKLHQGTLKGAYEIYKVTDDGAIKMLVYGFLRNAVSKNGILGDLLLRDGKTISEILFEMDDEIGI